MPLLLNSFTALRLPSVPFYKVRFKSDERFFLEAELVLADCLSMYQKAGFPIVGRIGTTRELGCVDFTAQVNIVGEALVLGQDFVYDAPSVRFAIYYLVCRQSSVLDTDTKTRLQRFYKDLWHNMADKFVYGPKSNFIAMFTLCVQLVQTWFRRGAVKTVDGYTVDSFLPLEYQCPALHFPEIYAPAMSQYVVRNRSVLSVEFL